MSCLNSCSWVYKVSREGLQIKNQHQKDWRNPNSNLVRQSRVGRVVEGRLASGVRKQKIKTGVWLGKRVEKGRKTATKRVKKRVSNGLLSFKPTSCKLTAHCSLCPCLRFGQSQPRDMITSATLIFLSDSYFIVYSWFFWFYSNS